MSDNPNNRDAMLEWLIELVRRRGLDDRPPLDRIIEAASGIDPAVRRDEIERGENVPPSARNIFSGLFRREASRASDRASGDEQIMRDHVAVAEMRASLTHILQTCQQHSAAIVRLALLGLGRIGTAAEHMSSIAPFLDQQWEQDVRLAAINALSNLGGEEAVDKLIALLGDPDIVVRWEAQAALDRLLVGADSAVVQSASTSPAFVDDDDDIPF